MTQIRQPIVTVVGHVDHGKTSILDCFRGTCVQESEAGGITQKISFTKYPLTQIKSACPLIDKNNIHLEIPGFLFIDTPGHAAFTNLRKRGGSLADLAILVVSIKDGIKLQTAEVLQILKNYKTPFVVALNKIDTISGWKTQKEKTLKESIESQPLHTSQEFEESLLTFQGSLAEYGFNSDIFFNISDFTKKIAIVPCSAKTREGIPEILLSLCGLSQKFLKERLSLSNEAKGIILEIKKEKTLNSIETILYDGTLKENDEIAIATFEDIVVTKIRALEEVEPLSFRYKPKKEVIAATGARIHLANREGILPGMPFQKITSNLEGIRESFKKELSQAMQLDKKGVIVKADSLGSLETILSLLKQENIKVVYAGIGAIGKSDIVRAKTNIETNPLDAIILGFNVEKEENIAQSNVKIITGEVIYKIIEDLQSWRKNKIAEIERAKLISLSPICKLEILHRFVFRNSNPAIFGVKVLAGKLRVGQILLDEAGEEVARVKSLQVEKQSTQEATEGKEIALALPGIYFERRLTEVKFLYSNISSTQFKKFKENKELLSAGELKILQELADIKRKKDENWGI